MMPSFMQLHEQFGSQLLPLLKRAKRVLVIGTEGPDGDSVGSMLAMAHAAQHHDCDVTCFSPERIPAMFDYLKNQHQIMTELADTIHDYDLAIIVDTGDVKRTPLVKDMVARNPEKTVVVNIDHHQTVVDHEGQRAVDHSYVDTRAASTTEIITTMLKVMGVPITPPIATALLTGILTDTGHFSNSGTTINAIELAAELMARGARHDIITNATMKNKTIGTLKLWGRALTRLKQNTKLGMVTTVVTLKDFEECDADEDATIGIANFMNTLVEGKIALVLQEAPGGWIKGSFRTTSDINVADMAAKFGGGGHPKAAGFKVRGTLRETKTGWEVVAVS